MPREHSKESGFSPWSWRTCDSLRLSARGHFEPHNWPGEASPNAQEMEKLQKPGLTARATAYAARTYRSIPALASVLVMIDIGSVDWLRPAAVDW